MVEVDEQDGRNLEAWRRKEGRRTLAEEREPSGALNSALIYTMRLDGILNAPLMK